MGRAAMLAGGMLAMPADAAVTLFKVSGQFENLETLSGTLGIDTVAGTVNSGVLTVSGANGFTADVIKYNATYRPYAGYLFIASIDQYLQTYVTLLIDTPLVGYQGGALFSTARPSATDYTSGYIQSQNGYALDFGALTRAGVPEPTMWAFMVIGFGLVGTAARRRRTVAAA